MCDKKNILFVDNEQNVLDGLRRMLRSMSSEWDMAFASGGDEALGKVELEEGSLEGDGFAVGEHPGDLVKEQLRDLQCEPHVGDAVGD